MMSYHVRVICDQVVRFAETLGYKVYTTYINTDRYGCLFIYKYAQLWCWTIWDDIKIKKSYTRTKTTKFFRTMPQISVGFSFHNTMYNVYLS